MKGFSDLRRDHLGYLGKTDNAQFKCALLLYTKKYIYAINNYVMTLTEFTYSVKKFGPFVVAFLLFTSILLLTMQIVSKLPKPVKPIIPVYDAKYGKMDKLVFHGVSSKDFTFELDTLRGIPVLQINDVGDEQKASPSARIYKLALQSVQSNYKVRLQQIARRLGLSNNFTEDNGIANFVDPNKILVTSIADYNFEYELKQASYGGVISNKNTITEQAISFLRSMNRYPNALSQEKKIITYQFYDDKTNTFITIPDNESSKANCVLVDFPVAPVNNLSVFSSTYNNADNYVLLTYDANKRMQVLKARVWHYDIIDSDEGNYKIKTVEEAYKDLTEGRGSVLFAQGQVHKVNRAYLGYYSSKEYQEYLQPIYVFTNADKTFVAYVQAIQNQYIKDEIMDVVTSDEAKSSTE